VKNVRVGITTAALLSLVSPACGGASYEKAPAASPATAPAPSPETRQPTMDQSTRGAPAPSGAYPAPPTTPSAQESAAPPAPAPASPAAPADRDTAGRQATMRRAAADLRSAQQQLEASMGDCVAACRALGSMERATGHMCDLATATDDRRLCEDAKTRVLAARDRVRATCGTCPGGPSLERSAPIPSR
jgi:hypothetical protein